MISDFQKFILPDANKKNNIKAEVNWNPTDVNSNECKIIKFILPNGKESYIKRDDLNEILFAIGKAEDQRRLIPQKLTHVKWYETVVGVKATKDIKKGEVINFPIKLSLPAGEEEVIGEPKGSSIIVPT